LMTQVISPGPLVHSKPTDCQNVFEHRSNPIFFELFLNFRLTKKIQKVGSPQAFLIPSPPKKEVEMPDSKKLR